MTNLMQASHQWATRPADERFLSLTALRDHTQQVKARATARRIASQRILAVPSDSDHEALFVQQYDEAPAKITHWAFGQLAQRAGAPAGYLRDLPAPIAADCINYGLKFTRDNTDLATLSSDGGNGATLLAVTGPNYGRVWNHTIAQSLVSRFGDGISGDFRVPGEFGKRVPVTLANTTIYASDRDMFVFLADEEHRIEVKNRRNGGPGTLSRGFFLWNSEVGSTSFGVATFLFDYVCCNRIVWGAEEYRELRLRHTSRAPQRWVDDVLPVLNEYANSETRSTVKQIESAQKAKIDDVSEFLNKRFSRGVASAMMATHVQEEQRPVETLWDAATAVTAYAKGVLYQNERVGLEREAGKILDLAA